MKEWILAVSIKALQAMTLDYEAGYLFCIKNGIEPTSKNIITSINNKINKE